MNFNKLMTITLGLAAISSTQALAHSTLVTREAAAESYFVAQVQIPHGCDGKDTNAVSVKMPEGFILAKPMPKAGWTLEIIKGDYQKTYENHGTEVKSGPVEIIWKDGSLPDDFYDVFTMQGKVTGIEAGTALPFIVTQTCGDEKLEWNEIAKDGEDPHALKHPAPLLMVTEPAHHHH
ncbi:YcnI family protein [Rhizobium sp. L1K21]|uniref:YcnI family copper-binding membrane protein n=1 Tax=Rhizobium sp. L1K21 TaxID=2954933 RepID=UPI002092A365|nr:DUF1775 domain-containing protein [Rhizobium sp. L1K21]MCO6185394.1 DUF1775 domain-containing protein [Rhizobium sp. L1K21]